MILTLPKHLKHHILTLLMLAFCGLSLLALEAPFAGDPAISPDGEQVCFVYDNDLWVVSFAGGVPRRITNTPSSEWNPQWSPDGATIAFSSNRDGNNFIYIIPASGGSPLYTVKENMIIADWFSDSQYLLCSKYSLAYGRSFYKVPIDGFRPQMIAEIGARYATLTPDNTQIIFQQGGNGYREAYRGSANGELWLLDIPTKKYTRLTNTDYSELYPRCSHLTGSLFYGASDTEHIQIMRSDGYDLKLVSQLSQFKEYSARDLSVARSNDRMVFEMFDTIYKFDPTKFGGNRISPLEINLLEDGWQNDLVRRTYKNSFGSYAVSPDNLLLAFGQGYDAFFMPIKGGEVKQITQDHTNPEQMLFIDNRNVLINKLHDGKFRLFTAKADSLIEMKPLKWFGADSLNVEEITRDDQGRFSILYSDYFRHNKIAIADSGLVNIRPIDTPWSVVTDFVFNKLGTHAVYGTMRDDSYIRELYLYETDSGTSRKLLADDGWISSLTWTPDNRSILLSRSRSIYRLDLIPRDELELEKDHWREILFPEIARADTSATPKEELSVDIESVDESESLSAYLEKRDVKVVWEGLEKRYYEIITSAGDYLYPIKTLSDSTFYYLQQGAGESRSSALKKANIYGENIKEESTFGKEAGSFAWNAPYLYYLEGERLKSYDTSSSKKKDISSEYEYQYDKKILNRRVFEEAWSVFGNNFYDPDMHGRDWDKVYQQFLPYAEKARSINDIAEVINEMIGDVNASHTGFYPRVDSPWTYRTAAYLGLETEDAEPLRKGIRIATVYPTSKLAAYYSLKPGAILTHVDGIEIESKTPLEALLAGKTGKKIKLSFLQDGLTLNATITGLSYYEQRELWYTYDVANKRRLVDELSGGKLGYVHIPSMGEDDWSRFYSELFRDNYDKEALVIDVRGNTGGHIHDQIISLLQKKRYAFSRSRNQGLTLRFEPRRSWDKPSIVLVDEESFSDGEIFPTIYQELKLGKVVGTPSSGAVIGTWHYNLLDGSSMRMPGTGWYKLDGTNMEGTGAMPDIIVENPPEDRIAGKDNQLIRAVQELLGEL